MMDIFIHEIQSSGGPTMMFLIRIDHQSTTDGVGASSSYIESILKGVPVSVEDYSVSELEAFVWVYSTRLVS
jgi:hypothetical protein